jgi:hypothetical protein
MKYKKGRESNTDINKTKRVRGMAYFGLREEP